jgi:hypothetical protein
MDINRTNAFGNSDDSWESVEHVEIVQLPDDYDDQRENVPPSFDESMYVVVMMDPDIELTPPRPPPRPKKNKPNKPNKPNKSRKRKGQLRI